MINKTDKKNSLKVAVGSGFVFFFFFFLPYQWCSLPMNCASLRSNRKRSCYIQWGYTNSGCRSSVIYHIILLSSSLLLLSFLPPLTFFLLTSRPFPYGDVSESRVQARPGVREWWTEEAAEWLENGLQWENKLTIEHTWKCIKDNGNQLKTNFSY